MAHTIFENKVIENQAESILLSKFNAQGYMKVDNSLTAKDGMKITIHTFKVEGELEELTEGQGNSQEFTVKYEGKEYEVKTLQGKYSYTDEQAMKDSFAIDTLIGSVADEFVNVANKKFFTELGKATLTVEGASASGVTFDNIVDALALFKENSKAKTLFINPKHVAKLRKNLKELLSLNNDVVLTGYIGTVAGVNVVMSNLVEDGEAYIATGEAVTMFGKKGMENEVDRDADKRTTNNYLRKVYTIALTDEREVVKVTLS